MPKYKDCGCRDDDHQACPRCEGWSQAELDRVEDAPPATEGTCNQCGILWPVEDLSSPEKCLRCEHNLWDTISPLLDDSRRREEIRHLTSYVAHLGRIETPLVYTAGELLAVIQHHGELLDDARPEK